MTVTRMVTFDLAERRMLQSAFNPWRIVVYEPYTRRMTESEAQEKFGKLFTRVLHEHGPLPASAITAARGALSILRDVLSVQSAAGYWHQFNPPVVDASVNLADITAARENRQL